MSATANVHIGLNNKLESSNAAKLIGCSYSHVLNLIKAKKLRAQKIQNQWWVEHDDVNRYRVHFKPRMKHNKLTVIKGPDIKKTEIKLEIDKEKFDLIVMVLSKQGKTLPGYLNEKITELHQRIDASLSTVQM